MGLSHLEMILRIVLAGILGGAIGYERDRHRRPVGLRTHAIVAVASATFMVVSSQFAYYQHYLRGEGINVDGSRIAASVVSAIGFLAGGAILRTGPTVQGLTTAAALWLVTAIGLSSGSGMFPEAVIVTVIGLGVLGLLRRVPHSSDEAVERKITVVLAPGTATAPVLDGLVAIDVSIVDVEYERPTEADAPVELRFAGRMSSTLEPRELVAAIEKFEGVRRVRVSAVRERERRTPGFPWLGRGRGTPHARA